MRWSVRRDHDASALEAACARAVALQSIGYDHVRRLLLVAQVQAPLPLPTVTHEHVRGGDYYDVHGWTSAARGTMPEAAAVSGATEVAHAA